MRTISTIALLGGVGLLSLHTISGQESCTVTTAPTMGYNNATTYTNNYCATYHTELPASQVYCAVINEQGTITGSLDYTSSDTTFTCPYGINVDYFEMSYYDPTSTHATISTTFTAGQESFPSSTLTPGTCLTWTQAFTGQIPAPTSVTWNWHSAAGGTVHGLWFAYAMYCTQPVTTSAPTSTSTPTTPLSTTISTAGDNCICTCCTGNYCTASTVGGFVVSTSTDCTNAGCISAFPSQCPSSTQSGSTESNYHSTTTTTTGSNSNNAANSDANTVRGSAIVAAGASVAAAVLAW